ncbi:MAG: hypothetical protein J6K82_03500 [Alphaproteobacteria bacterium]|nr:hypothetical protein [Alphaproteobacteria bacterium]
MKRFVAVLSSLLVLPAFAEIAPISYEEIVEYSDAEITPDETDEVVEDVKTVVTPMAQPSSVNARSRTTNAAISRAVPATATSVANQRNVAAGRVTAAGRSGATTARTVTSRNTTATRANAARTVTSRNAANSRVANTVAARSAVAGRGNTNATAQIATTRRAMTNTGASAARASIIQTDTVNTPLYTGRVSTRSSAIRARIPTISATSGTTTTTTTSVADTEISMDELAQITDFCKAQYTQCMDNFCNVLDDNQGRCSCSKNIKNYAETEAALKEATEALQDVAQEIQYIGLTSDEVETLFTQTEAELTMSKTSDNTTLKNDLDRIKKLIIDVKPGSASSTTVDTGMAFDLSGLLDFNIDSTGFDLSSLFGGTSTNTNSISNQRGEQLYKTATARCKKAVLTDCAAQGVDISIITNAYDLEIDKQCIAYERELTETNDEMAQTVRNAKSVLQRARLMVAQQKNAYDLRGCVSALDSCMQDDFVCGSDYENCLDPSGKYIVNGEIVVGSMPGAYNAGTDAKGLYETWNYTAGESTKKQNAWATDGKLGDYINATVTTTMPITTSDSISEFLQNKIGYNSEGKNYGMCISVLNKCQDYTYGSDAKYMPDNQVIKEFLQRTLVQIKNMQDDIIADYAEQCITDVSSCLASNNYDPDDNISSTSNMTTKNKIAINACFAQIKSCMSVNGVTDDNNNFAPQSIDVYNWIRAISGEVQDTQTCDSATARLDTKSGKCACIDTKYATLNADNISCSCPEGLSFDKTGKCDIITDAATFAENYCKQFNDPDSCNNEVLEYPSTCANGSTDTLDGQTPCTWEDNECGFYTYCTPNS